MVFTDIVRLDGCMENEREIVRVPPQPMDDLLLERKERCPKLATRSSKNTILVTPLL